jgi:hypothetical protein
MGHMSDDVEKALEDAETEDTVVVTLLVPTGITLGGRPHPRLGHVRTNAEVTLSGLMEIQAILERGGLVKQGNVVNEAERVILPLLDGGAPRLLARDIVGLLAEKGLLRKGA